MPEAGIGAGVRVRGKHAVSACQNCDCSKCSAEVKARLNDSDTGDAMLCSNAFGCSERNKCVSYLCYCGTANEESCVDTPRGVCLQQWQDAARTTRPSTIAFLIRTPGYTLNHAVALIDCRATNCGASGTTPSSSRA
jgi:hypothetical protein